MEGNHPFTIALPAKHDKAEAEAEAARLEQLRLERNRQADAFVYKERGDAFRRPFRSDERFWVKGIEE